MSVKLIIPKKKNNLRAENVPIGHVCKDTKVGSIALRTQNKLLFLLNFTEVHIQDCKETYDDLGPLEIEFSDS